MKIRKDMPEEIKEWIEHSIYTNIETIFGWENKLFFIRELDGGGFDVKCGKIGSWHWFRNIKEIKKFCEDMVNENK